MRVLLPAAGACVAGVFLAAGTAVAVVTFDPATGEGRVGRGDVRDAFDWTLAEFRDRAGAVSFAYVDSKTYRVECRSDDRAQTFSAHIAREKQVTDKPRRRDGAVVGFDLLGYGGETSSTDLFQEEGAPCRGSDDDGSFTGEWGPVKQVRATKGLVVRYHFQEHEL